MYTGNEIENEEGHYKNHNMVIEFQKRKIKAKKLKVLKVVVTSGNKISFYVFVKICSHEYLFFNWSGQFGFFTNFTRH